MIAQVMSVGTPERIVGVISKLLTDLVARNDQLPLSPTQVTPFHSSKPPTISVKSYLEDRILKYAGCSEETFILALIYMDQVVQFNPEFVISSLNVHRLLITRRVPSPPPPFRPPPCGVAAATRCAARGLLF